MEPEADVVKIWTKEDMEGITPIRAIRAKCLDCSPGSFKEVKLCPVEDCALLFVSQPPR